MDKRGNVLTPSVCFLCGGWWEGRGGPAMWWTLKREVTDGGDDGRRGFWLLKVFSNNWTQLFSGVCNTEEDLKRTAADPPS